MGTGVMVGPDIVYTAAHNVYDNSTPVRKRSSNIKFTPGMNGDLAPFGVIDVKDIYVPNAYINQDPGTDNKKYSEDYALLRLEEPIGMRAGYFGFHVADKSLLQKKKISIIGYAQDKGNKT